MNIAIIILLCTVSLILAYFHHSKYDPAWYFSLIWGLQILLIYPLFNHIFIFPLYGLLYISIATLFFSLGSISGEINNKIITHATESYTFNINRSKIILIILIILSFIYPTKYIYERGFNISQLFSLSDLLMMNNSIAIERYTDSSQSPSINQIFLTICYLAPLYGGYSYVLQTSKKWHFFCIMSLFSLLLTAITQNTKMGFLSGCFLFISGMLTSCFVNKIALPHISLKLITKSVIIVLLIITVLFLTMIFRTGQFDMDTIVQIEHKFIGYAFGHLPSFDIWFESYINMPEHTYSYGTKFFYGISNYLGIAEREQGVFQDLLFYGKNGFNSGTNIFTVFRILIEDVGPYFSLLVLFILGYTTKFAMILIQNNKLFYISQIIVLSIFFFTFWSFATSVFAYTSYILMFVLMYILLRISYTQTAIIKVQ